jgi:hypothetical protein
MSEQTPLSGPYVGHHRTFPSGDPPLLGHIPEPQSSRTCTYVRNHIP